MSETDLQDETLTTLSTDMVSRLSRTLWGCDESPVQADSLLTGDREGAVVITKSDLEAMLNEAVHDRKEMARAAECQLATLERYRMLKRASKSETERHRSIALRMVNACRKTGVEIPRHWHCGRLKEALKTGEV